MRGVLSHSTFLPYLKTANEEYSKLCEARNTVGILVVLTIILFVAAAMVCGLPCMYAG
jgi:hypothetical protein